MKIRKLQLKNIGVFDDETIEFQPCPVEDKAEIHIFTGQNGSGKSTLLMALAGSFDNFQVNFVDDHDDEFGRASFVENINISLKNSFQLRFKDCNISKSSVFFDKSVTGSPTIISKTLEGFKGRFSKPVYYYSEYVRNYHSWRNPELEFAAFAFSGYRQLKEERVEAIKESSLFSPLSQSLEFVKDYNQENQLTINQLIANNISKSAIEKGRNEEKSKRFANVINTVEQAIYDITSWKIEFDLETEPTKLIIKINGEELDFDVLPDGLRSLISWIADLAGRVDLLKWQDDMPIFEKNLILFLDEIEVHLHPAWQRKVLPVVQKLFKNAQIFVSTHSPFVVNSVDDAWVYKLKLENGKARVAEVVRSEDGISYQTVLSEIFDIDEEFGGKTQENLNKFYKIVRNGKKIDETELLNLAKSLAEQSDELNAIVQIELRQLSRRKGKEFSL